MHWEHAQNAAAEAGLCFSIVNGEVCGQERDHDHCCGCRAEVDKGVLLCRRCSRLERRLSGVSVEVHAEAEADAYRALDMASEQHRDSWEGLSER